MKPFVITDKATHEILKECDDFSEGWDHMRDMKDCELMRVEDSVVLAHKGRLVVDETVPFILLQDISSPIKR